MRFDGLHVIDIDKKETFFYFSSNTKNQVGKQTLINDALEDKYHILWLGSLNGLIEFNPFQNKRRYLMTIHNKKLQDHFF